MVLPGKLGGRVGRRRIFFKTRNQILIPGFFMDLLSLGYAEVKLKQKGGLRLTFIIIPGQCPVAVNHSVFAAVLQRGKGAVIST
jgi:hypothetical protein